MHEIPHRHVLFCFRRPAVRDDMRLYIRGKRNRAAFNPALATNHSAARFRFPLALKTLLSRPKGGISFLKGGASWEKYFWF